MNTERIEVREFDLPPGAPDWREVNEMRSSVIIAFARAPVGIHHEGGRELVADRCCAMLYNPGERYRRTLLDERGDNCVFAVVPADLAAELSGSPDRPVPLPRVPVGDEDVLTLARLRRAQRTGDERSATDLAGALVRRVLRRAAAIAATPVPHHGQRDSTRGAHEELIERTLGEIARTFAEKRTLADIARSVHSSPFHLARTFRDHTGRSVCGHRMRLRLAAAAGMLAESDRPITRIALETGFSSHAHLTTAFGRAFGVPPSALRG